MLLLFYTCHKKNHGEIVEVDGLLLQHGVVENVLEVDKVDAQTELRKKLDSPRAQKIGYDVRIAHQRGED